MTAQKQEQKMVSFLEDPDIVQQLIDRADAEGTSLSALIRRAIRREYFSLPAAPTSGNCAEVADKAA